MAGFFFLHVVIARAPCRFAFALNRRTRSVPAPNETKTFEKQRISRRSKIVTAGDLSETTSGGRHIKILRVDDFDLIKFLFEIVLIQFSVFIVNAI